MELIELPIASNAAHFIQQNDIFEKSFFLEFEWLDREKYWQLHVNNDQRLPLRNAIKLQFNWPLYVNKLDDHYFVLMLLPPANKTSLYRQNLRECTLVAHVPTL